MKFINPNNHDVNLDLGNPSRRNIQVRPYASVAQRGDTRARVVEMTEKKAEFYCSIGMIVALSNKAPEFNNPPDVDVTALEEEARALVDKRYGRGGQQAAAETQNARRAQVEEEFRKNEATELAEAADVRARIAASNERREAAADAKNGIFPTAEAAEKAPAAPLANTSAEPVQPAENAQAVKPGLVVAPGLAARRAQIANATAGGTPSTNPDTLAPTGVKSFGVDGDGTESIEGGGEKA